MKRLHREGEEDVLKLAHWTTLEKKFGCTPEQIMFCYKNLRSAYAKILKPVKLVCDAGPFTERAKFILLNAGLQCNKKGGGEQ